MRNRPAARTTVSRRRRGAGAGALDNGLLAKTAGPSDEVVKLLPALTISESDLDRTREPDRRHRHGQLLIPAREFTAHVRPVGYKCRNLYFYGRACHLQLMDTTIPASGRGVEEVKHTRPCSPNGGDDYGVGGCPVPLSRRG